MSLLAHYTAAIVAGDIEDDPLQREVLLIMERIHQQLMRQQKSILPWRRHRPISGLYLYGEVGVGKTFLMDLFFEQIALENKLRFHFHHFMQQIDAQLRQRQGQKNPVQAIAKDLAKEASLLCFDEFLVDDVADAMILAELFQALLDNGLVLVMTSNAQPDNLYLNGVHRERFLPAIESIQSHCQIYYLSIQRDYRLGREAALETYLWPISKNSDQLLKAQFSALESQIQGPGCISVQKREVAYIMRGERLIWFDFKVICNVPRSQLDYLEIAERFDTVFISDIPLLTENDTIYAILFIHLIDVLYDRSIRLVISAAAPLEALYIKGEMTEAFKRTYSRLEEMQSADYLKRHKRRAVKEISKHF